MNQYFINKRLIMLTTKKIILFFPFPLLSHYLRCLQLASVLKDDFEILFPASVTYNSFVFEAGFDTFSCENFDARAVMEKMNRFDFTWLNTSDIERVFLSQVKAIEQYSPVAVLGDAAPTIKMAAEKVNIPYFSLINGYLTKYYDCSRALPQRFIISQFLHLLPSKPVVWLSNIGEIIVFKNIHIPFSKLRAKYHLNKKNNYLDELEGDFNFICDLVDIFPQKTLPGNYKIIGPLFYQSDKKENNVLDKINNGKRTILISTGSANEIGALEFLKSDYFNKFNIVIAGKKNLLPGKSNVIYNEFLNTNSILPFVDVTICHGGNGTIYQSLAYGVPVICFPLHMEQEWNAERINQLRLGTTLSKINHGKQLMEQIEYWMDKKNTPPLKNLATQISIDDLKINFKDEIMRIS